MKVAAAVGSFLLPAGPASASDWSLRSLLLYGGPSFGADYSFGQAEVVANFRTPWHWSFESGLVTGMGVVCREFAVG